MGRRILNCFKTEIEKIKTEYLRIDCKALLMECSDYICDAPASSSGKYHPPWSNGVGGLLRHTRAVCKLTELMLQQDPKYDNDIEWDIIYIGALLHDMKKYTEKDQKYIHNEHAIMMGDAIRSKFADSIYWPLIADIVDTHMSRWHTDKNGKELGKPPTKPEHYIVAYADYLCAKKVITIKFDDLNQIIVD